MMDTIVLHMKELCVELRSMAYTFGPSICVVIIGDVFSAMP